MSITQNPVESEIKKHIRQTDTIFIFPTQASASEWADRATEISGAKAVATERFLAWDNFKGTAIRSAHQNKESIPSIMRSFFAQNLIKQNAQSPFLSYFITKEYAQKAGVFADYIASLLPSLKLWKKHFEKENLPADQEDKDLLELYKRYESFLEENNLFDPAWETPPFNPDGKKYILFFPEILMDYLEYKEILESTKEITLVHIPPKNEAEALEVHQFANVRDELHFAAQSIRRLHETEKIPYTSIALSVPDLDTYGPYINRELSLYEIPHVQKNGKPLSSYGAGALFSQIASCSSEDFYFSTLKVLLGNNELPWKTPELNTELIHFGKENNCLLDVWETAFEKPKNHFASKEVKKHYRDLRHSIKAITGAKTFAEIRTQYFSFRTKFFDMEKCTPEADLILSRCIAELSSLIDLEQRFPDCTLPSPYSFFTNHLSNTLYLAQNASLGVQVIPYRLGSSAPFEAHIVLDASQKSLTTVYKELSFLRDDKRKKLGLTEDKNISPLFLRLYALSSVKETIFSCSERTFTGYAIPHSEFTKITERNDEEEIQSDIYRSEKKALLGNTSFPSHIPLTAKKSFYAWSRTHAESNAEERVSREIEKLIEKKFYDGEKLSVSYSALSKFYKCPRSWLLERVLHVKPEDNEATLMDEFAQGNLYHKILEYYCKTLKENSMALKAEDKELPDAYKKILNESVCKAIEDFNSSEFSKSILNSERASIYRKMKASVVFFSSKFNGYNVYAVEQEYNAPSADGTYLYTGRIDCLLQNSVNGAFYLVDFKSTSGAVHKDSFYISDEVKIPDFQMPMYIYLLKNQKNGITLSGTAFYAVSDMKLFPVTGIDSTCEDFSPTQEAFFLLSDDFAKKISEKKFEVTGEVEFKTCRECEYCAVCRRTFTVGRKTN